MIQERSYQRKYLRAPFKLDLLYTFGGKLRKANSLSLSEGGMLLSVHNHLPSAGDEVRALALIPQFPYFKNFTLEKLKTYSPDLLPAKFAKFSLEILRTFTNEESGKRNMGAKITEINDFDLSKIANYVSVFSSNIIYLLVLMDSIDADKHNHERIRILADIIGYDSSQKLALLRKELEFDYKSLQWL